MPVGGTPRTRVGWVVAAEASAVVPTAIAKPAANTAARWIRLMRIMSLLAGAVGRRRPDAMVCDIGHAALSVP
jgi:hypothetical protein